MSNYILNPKTALIIDAEVYYLVREKKQTKNDVCQLCSLYAECRGDGDIPRFSYMCVPESGYEGWFFQRNIFVTRYKAKSLVECINDTFVK